jgi:hypothetical protein
MSNRLSPAEIDLAIHEEDEVLVDNRPTMQELEDEGYFDWEPIEDEDRWMAPVLDPADCTCTDCLGAHVQMEYAKHLGAILQYTLEDGTTRDSIDSVAFSTRSGYPGHVYPKTSMTWKCIWDFSDAELAYNNLTREYVEARRKEAGY